MKVCDLLAPPGFDRDGNGSNIVRFCWSLGIDGPSFGSSICVIDKNGRQSLPREEARDLWRRLRKAGWVIADPPATAFQDTRDEMEKVFDEACLGYGNAQACCTCRYGVGCCVHPLD